MSRASNLAGFVTSISPVSNLNVGVVTASSFVGNLTGTVTGTASTAAFATTSFGLSGSPDITVNQLTASVISAGSTTGTTGQVLQSTGTGIGWTTASAGITELGNVIPYNTAGIRSDSANGRLGVFGVGQVRVFTSPGTFVVNPGISSIRVRVVGAGGNGGTGGLTFAPIGFRVGGGGGGGGGGYAHKVITSFTAPRTYTVTVGSAPGGTSSFGSEVSATGGSNGTSGTPAPGASPSPPAAGGSGGTGSSGDVNFTGATGSPGDQANFAGTGGAGGAAATQKGNGSGKSVPGLPTLNIPGLSFSGINGYEYFITDGVFRNTNINRFPFDIFTGMEGMDVPSPFQPQIAKYPGSTIARTLNGFEGGGGANGFAVGPGLPFAPSWIVGGNGGTAAGGGGGGVFSTNGSTGGSGGFGGGGGGGGGADNPGFAGSGGSGGAGIVIVEW